MNITVRIVSLSIYLFIMLIMFYFISKCKNSNKLKKLLIIYTIILSILAYFYSPYKTADLYRIYEMMELYYQPLDLGEFVKWAINKSDFIGMSYFYIFSKIGNYNLLPAFTCFIFYNIIFYIYLKSYESNKIKSSDLGLIFLIIMAGGQYIEVISGIRFMLAIAIFIFCVYNEYFKNKSIILDIPLYVIASLMHSAALVLVLLRFISLLFQKENNKSKKIIVFFITLVLGILALYFGANNIYSAFQKGSLYINNDVYNYNWEYIIAAIYMIYIWLCLKTLKRINKYDYMESKKYINFFKILYVITVICVPTYSIFHRYRSVLGFMFIPLLFYIYSSLSKEGYEIQRQRFNKTTILFLFILFALVFIRGNLCGLNFFN